MGKHWNVASLGILAAFLVAGISAHSLYDSLRYGDPCEFGSCYPATGNLLIGRENRLTVSSTCGLQREERYCVPASTPEDKKQCYRCDSRSDSNAFSRLSHRIENVVKRTAAGTIQRSWWQSENGVEDVTIQMDLEGIFHFTHMIMIFKTFRPAAMIIEKSFDGGNTWKPYRYFADNCTAMFPDIDPAPPTSLSHVVCDERYSGAAPSTDGEVIFRVLPRNVQITDPYADDVQNLLKASNLRVHFKNLHTLQNEPVEADPEMYYYALYEMAVRGSCSCNGHASQCLPLPGSETGILDMIHGKCDCKHNTKGLNCQECDDMYQDFPWAPAIGKQSNACKRCNCNNHAVRCHFDKAVFEASGSASGGVCDDCMHNTMGRQCELCKPSFYLRPDRQIEDVDACQECACNPSGSIDGVCDAVTGQCRCRPNMTGRDCSIPVSETSSNAPKSFNDGEDEEIPEWTGIRFIDSFIRMINIRRNF